MLDIARLDHITRARASQIVNLTPLAPDVQEKILMSQIESGVPGTSPAVAVREANWANQRALLAELLKVKTTEQP
ncbi:MAG TPA: hypothetical protein VJM82_07985 [Nitrospiraceae bacterium]|nr:hypothetical protein [Nitrospiraceae bacterium]